MSFTNPQMSRAWERLKNALKANGVTNIPYGKDELRAAADALKVTVDGATYRNAQSTAIDTAMPLHTVPTSHKKIIHEATLDAMVREGLL